MANTFKDNPCVILNLFQDLNIITIATMPFISADLRVRSEIVIKKMPLP